MADNTERNAVVLELIFNDDKLQTQLNTSLKMIEQKAVKTSENVVSKATQSINAIGNKAVAAAKNAGIEATTTAKETSKTVKSEAESVNQKINAILSDSNRSMKSKAASIASIYRKQGMDGSTAFKKAWEQIERTSKVSANNINKTVGGVASNMVNEFNVAAKKSTNSLNSFSKSATNVFGGIAKMAIAAFSVKKIAGFTKSCLELGSNLTEVQNIVDVAFPNMNKKANEFAQSAMNNFGLSETAAKKYMGIFGQMSRSMGLSESKAYEMAEAVTGLTGDVASFFNRSTDEAYTKLKSIWTGETETLKDIAVVMTETNLNQYAMNNGWGKTLSNMTQQEKLMLRWQYVTSSLDNASGDFVRTQGSWANQTRILTEQFNALKASMGKGFIALFTPIIRGLNNIVGGLQKVADGFADLMQLITGVDVSASTGALNEGISSVGDDALAAAGNITAMGDATAAAAKIAERSLAGFDKISKLESAKTSSSGGATSSDGNTSKSNTKKETSGVSSAVEAMAKKIEAALNPLRKIKFDNLTASLQKLKTAAEPLTDKLFEGLEWAYNEIFVPLATWTIEEAVPAFLDTLTQALKTLNDVLEVFKPLANVLWEKLLEPIGEWTGGAIVGILNGITKSLEDLSAHIESKKPIFDALSEAVSVTGDTFESIWNNTISPIIANATEKIEKVWTEYLEPLMKSLADFAGEWINCALSIYNGFIAPLIGMLDKYLGPGIRLHFNNIVNIVTWAISLILNTINSLITTLKGCAQFVSGVFTGDWEKAWTGIKNIFEGIFSKGLVSIVRTAMNSIIGMINGMLSGFTKGVNAMVGAVNKISFKVPDWVPGIGGNSVGFNIATVSAPKIPMLAQGAYVEANTPQLAMIGDNRHQGEFVAPEDKLSQMAVDAAKMSGNSSAALLAEAVRILKEILKILKELDLDVQIDGESVKKKLVDLINENTRATGKCEIVT